MVNGNYHAEVGYWKGYKLALPSQPRPDGKVHGANMGPIWGRQDPGGPHVGPMTFAIWAATVKGVVKQQSLQLLCCVSTTNLQHSWE